MRNISTFGAFTTARMGIYAAQQGLNITGHNITNINTTGFTRQRLDQISLSTGTADRYTSRNMVSVGAGVLITGINQIRDPYLDIRYRNEQSSVGFADAKLAGLEELSSILDEVGRGVEEGGIMEAQFNDLITQIQNLSGKVGGQEFDTLVRSSASSLVRLFNSYAERLSVVKENKVAGLEQDVGTINGLLTGIRDLNNAIFKSDLRGDPGLELRDERNLLLDQLSQHMKISVTYEPVSVGAGLTIDKMVVRMAGTPEGAADAKAYNLLNPLPDPLPDPPPPPDPRAKDTSKSLLVDGGFVTQLSIKTIGTPPNEEYSPNFDISLSKLTNTKGEALADSDALMLRDNDIYGALQATREILTEAGEFTDESVVKTTGGVLYTDLNAATKRGIPYYQNALDSLARKLANTLNTANTGYLTDAGGNYVDKSGATFIYVDPAKVADPVTYPGYTGEVLTNKTALTADMRSALDDPTTGGIAMGGPLFSINSSSNEIVGITAANLSISQKWAAGETRIQNSMIAGTSGTTPNSTASDNIIRILSLMTGQQNYLPGDMNADSVHPDVPFFKGTFQEMLASMSGTLATDLKSTSTLLNTYTISSNEIETNRSSVSGVDLNDEATSLMQYQKSYSAACRLMTTLDEALEKLINGTGIVGR